VGSVDVDDLDAVLAKVAAEGGPVGAGPFHADASELSMGAEPLEQVAVTRGGGGGLLVAKAPAGFGEHKGVMGVLVAVYPADDNVLLPGTRLKAPDEPSPAGLPPNLSVRSLGEAGSRKLPTTDELKVLSRPRGTDYP
jgi:hypothetical protein